jgi:magnesium transporter
LPTCFGVCDTALPDHLDRLFVVDVRNVLRGAVSLKSLVIGKPDTPVAAVMEADPLAFHPEDTAVQAARAFERYDLVSVPVINERGKLVGRLTVDAVVDFIGDAVRMRSRWPGCAAARTVRAIWYSARNRSPGCS